MAEKKRWIAMYTKHIKQKRKVMLYDEAENLLESRMVKADEVVSSGATLTFQAYLVDICDPMEGSTASSDPKVQPKCERKPFAGLRPNFKKTSLHSEERKPKFVNEVPSKSFSPSHKMIRVFKKRELHKYASLSPDTVKPTSKGTAPLGSAGKESNSHASINSACDDSRLENDNVHRPHKPLRDVNQILSILERRNVTETSYDNKLQTSSTKVASESDTRKRHKEESISSREASSMDSLPQEFMVPETSSTDCDDPPSFDLGI